MNRLFSGRSDMPFALLLLAPSLLLLGGLVAWPMLSNIEISFLRLPLNPNIESTFVGVSNYVRILSDPGFWHSLWMTVWYTTLVVAGSTVLGPWRCFSTASSACAKPRVRWCSSPT